MNKHILSILVENRSGALSRVVGLFSRRGYNIDSLSVGITEDPNISRITIVTTGDEQIINQISRQVEKLVDVIRVIELAPNDSVYRELTLVKIKALPEKRNELTSIVEIFRAKIIDVSNSTITVELTGVESKLDAFLSLVEPYEILEIVRTGVTGLERGAKQLKNPTKIEEE